MNEDSNPNFPDLSLDDRLIIENLCSEFDREWISQGESPSIEGYLSRVNELLHEALLEELIRIDKEYRQRQGKPLALEEHVKAFSRWKNAVHRAYHVSSGEDRKGDSTKSDASHANWLMAAQQAREIFELVRRFQNEGMASASQSTQDPTEWMDRQAPLVDSIQKTLAGFQRSVPVPTGIPSQRLGDFQIVRQIGRGGMGAVFEAEQISLKRKVALKILWVTSGQQEEARERFQREATTVANLHHTNIVPIFAVGEEQGFDYYAMQLIDGQSLDIVLRQSKEGLDWKRVANWGLQAAEALAHAHERGVVHRDVKPSNLILDSSARIWLTDFGLAKSPDDQSLSFAGAMIGTPRYMSPEQASAASNLVDHRSDIYSLGASLYELLSGRPVFDGDSPLHVIQQILKEEPKRLDKVQPEVPRDLVTVVMKCLNKDPSQRYASAKELADDLRSVSEGRPIKARRASTLEVFGKWLNRHAKVVRNVGASLVVVAFAIGIVVWSLASWKSYRLAYLRLISARESVVASVTDVQGNPIGSSISLPTQAPLEIEAGSYRVRLASPGIPSIESTVRLDPQSSVEFEVDPHANLVADPLPERMGYRVFDEPRGTIVSWDTKTFRFESKLELANPVREEWNQSDLKWKGSITQVVGLGRVDSKEHVEVVVAQSNVSSLWAIASDRGLLWKQSFSTSNPSTSFSAEEDVRGDVLTPPLLVTDVDGDAYQDLLVSIGQNPNEPRTDVDQVRRFVALLSGKSGRILWRYDIPNEFFAGRANQPIPRVFWWELADPFQTGMQNQSESIVRQGRLLRHLDRTTNRNAPHCETPQVQLVRVDGITKVGVQAASRLQLLHLENGAPFEDTKDLHCLPSVPSIVLDLNGDQSDDLLVIESLPAVANGVRGTMMPMVPQTRILAWSVSEGKKLWERILATELPPTVGLRSMPVWPVISNDRMLVPNQCNLQAGYLGQSLPWSGLEAIRIETGETSWNLPIPNADSRLHHFTSQNLWPGLQGEVVFVASIWGTPLQLIVECRNRLDGKLLWLQREPLSDTADVVEGIEHIAEERTVQVLLGGGRSTKLLKAFDEQTGRLKYQIPTFERFERKDLNQDGCKELCIYRDLGTEYAPRVQLTIAQSQEGEQWSALDDPYELGADFDQDGVQDLLVGKDLVIRAVSGATGAPLWTYHAPAPVHAWKFQTFETSMREWTDVLSPIMYQEQLPTAKTHQRSTAGMALREAWDIDHDGTGDVLVQAVCKTARAQSPVQILSGRTGKVLWKIEEESGTSIDPPNLQPWDLNGDGQLEILRIHASRTIRNTTAGPTAPWDATLYQVGSSEPLWSRSIIAGDSHSIVDQLRMAAYPRAKVMRSNSDEYWDLLCMTTETVLGVETPKYCWTVLSGKDGTASSPRIVQENGEPLEMLDRAITADVNGDGRTELLTMHFVEGKPESERGRIAVLELWNASNREKLWEWKRQVHERFGIENSRPPSKPLAVYSRSGAVRFALPIVDEKGDDWISLVSADGITFHEIMLQRSDKDTSKGPFCRIGDVDGDGDQELLCDDQGLRAIDVWKEGREWKRYDVIPSDPSVQIQVVHFDSQNRLLRATHSTMRWVKAWNADTGDLQWTVYGPRLAKRGHSTVQVLQSFEMESGWVHFSGGQGMHCVRQGRMAEAHRSFLSPSYDRLGSGPIDDFRWKRPLPWAQAVDQELGFGLPPKLPLFMAFVLSASGLLLLAPWIVYRLYCIQQLTMTGAFLGLVSIVGLDMAFFANSFPLSVFQVSPTPIEKLELAIQYAPFWLGILLVPKWIYEGRFRLMVFWLAMTVLCTLGMACLAIWRSVDLSPWAEGESFAWTFEPGILFYGAFAVCWIGVPALVCKGIYGRWFSRPIANATPTPVRLMVLDRHQVINYFFRIGVVAWIAYVVLIPEWIGRLYLPEGGVGGSFGLLETESGSRAPLWDPPKPYSGLMASTIRMPWQRVQGNAHLEIHLQHTLARLPMMIAVLCGLLLVLSRCLGIRWFERESRFFWDLGLGMLFLELVTYGTRMITWDELPTGMMLIAANFTIAILCLWRHRRRWNMDFQRRAGAV